MRRFMLLMLFLTGLVIIGLLFSFGMGISARREPAAIEQKAARAVWRFLVPGAAKVKENPAPASAEVIRAGFQLWVDRCVVCHGYDGTGDTTVGRGLHPKAPNLRQELTQRLSDGELFYAIEQGIPWTGMPAWGTGTPDGERESWTLVRLIRHLPKLTPEEVKEMEKLSPKSPSALERERKALEQLRRGRR